MGNWHCIDVNYKRSPASRDTLQVRCGLELSHRHALSHSQIERPEILYDPAGSDQLLVDGLAGEGFGTLACQPPSMSSAPDQGKMVLYK